MNRSNHRIGVRQFVTYSFAARTFQPVVSSVVLLQIFCGVGITVLAASGAQLSMEVSIRNPQNRAYHLHVVLTNNTAESIAVDKERLPWAAYSWSAWIKATRNDARKTPLRPGAPLVEYDGKAILQPGETLEGEIPLQAMFRKLLAEKDHSGVRIEWRCPSDLLPVSCANEGTSYLISKAGIREVGPQKD